ncbi:hypothetical protein OHA21_06195 [Actinoplanes sp. NBC_00393]|uniref:hypothetical protein n=1 Tax=Actinoplanes sp. NBC_00393 TaxID=2975953 RepID=UPI002E24BD5E
MRMTEARQGRLIHGLAQTLAVWLTAALAVLLVPHPAAAWAGIGVGLVASVLLGQWHQRRSRADTAVGAFTGAGLWPILIAITLIAINIVSMSTSDYE